MFSKPFSIFLVYLLTVINFIILALPFLVAIYPFIQIEGNQITIVKYLTFSPKIAIFSLAFTVSFLMIFYLFLDFLFGFSVRFSIKGCKSFHKLPDYKFLGEIFDQVKGKFSNPNAKLLIQESDEINAFAVGGFGRKNIVLTSGLINHYAQNTEDKNQFLRAIRSILGHEMSHLVNKDFLPALLMIANQRITDFVCEFLQKLFNAIIKFSYFFGMKNVGIGSAMMTLYNLSSFFLSCFNRYVVSNLFSFLKNFFGRATEYRCDRQSAKAFGGMDMAFALSKLGKSGYFTLFSTHPSTLRRIKKVEVVEEKNAIIRPALTNQITNLASIIILPMICLYFAHISKIDLLAKFYLHQNYPEIYFRFIK